MPKGDPKRIQKAIDDQGGLSQNYLNNTRDDIKPQNQAFQNRFNVSADRSNLDYGNMMQGYDDFTARMRDPRSFGAYGGYEDFSQTGGFTPEQIAAMRGRGEGVIRSNFDTAIRGIDRQKKLTGGYSPGYAASMAKLTRDRATALGDQNINLEAQLADSIRSGKLAGLSGMTDIDKSRSSLESGALSGKTSLYGATPGQTDMYGNLLTQSNAQMIDIQQLQQAIAEMIINGQLGRGQMPTRFDAYAKAAQGTKDWMSVAGGAAAMSHSSLKKEITELTENDIIEKLNALKIFTWKYRGDDIVHMGPMAEDFTRVFGLGDGKTIALVDVMGVMMLACKALASSKEAVHV